MKRYNFGALLLCLAVPACSHQASNETTKIANDQTMPAETAQADENAGVYTEARTGTQEHSQSINALPGDQAEIEKMQVPEHNPAQQGATASSSSGGEIISASGSRTTAATSYGNPPGSHTQPGTTKALRPAQGASSTTLMKNEVVTDESAPGGDSALVGGPGTSGGAAASEQGTSSSDRTTTTRIRRAIMDDDSLSYTAKNVQVVTRNGNITLRGQVMTDKERWEIERITRGYAGSGKVDNDLTIKN